MVPVSTTPRTEDSVDDMEATDDGWPGSFATARRLQEQTMTVGGVRDRDIIQNTAVRPGSAMPHSTHNLPEVEDEAISNAAGIILLQTLSHLVKTNLEWIFNRVHFSCKFTSMTYNAYTDGALRSKTTSKIFGILEVKKRMRTVNPAAIFAQEACQVAGWLMESSAEMAVFNNQHQFFFTFAPFNENYESYLHNGTDTDVFLVMHTVGPFSTSDARQMAQFGRIFVAATLVAKSAAANIH
ncbi:hypothetical protein CBS147332_8296 [Penicillium roqueforti]|nr:hypothetical protein CBS147332_8296 [Penicillium roqueforti]KAI3099968.1 hypothetical protein CBS147331_8339 [Penicillium roqueforti]